MSNPLSAVVASTKSAAVIGELEARILGGDLSAGERLPTEAELCEQLGVSRSVVRDAIRTLAARGLVEVRQGRGITVAEPDTATFGQALVMLLSRSELTMGQVIEARAALETSLVRLAAERGDSQNWSILAGILDDLAEAVDDQDWETARRVHLSFHTGILNAVKLPAMELMLMPMTEVIVLSSTPPNANKPEDWSVERHALILDRLKDSDADGAEQAMRQHFSATADWPRYKQFNDAPFSAALKAARPT